VTFELFARPLIRRLAGHARPHRRTTSVALAEPLHLEAPLTHFLRVVLENTADRLPVARLTGAQSSGMLTSMSAADGLIVVPPDSLHLGAGATLRCLPLDGDLGGSAIFLG
jgi:molybdopterin molybdotransferase